MTTSHRGSDQQHICQMCSSIAPCILQSSPVLGAAQPRLQPNSSRFVSSQTQAARQGWISKREAAGSCTEAESILHPNKHRLPISFCLPTRLSVWELLHTAPAWHSAGIGKQWRRWRIWITGGEGGGHATVMLLRPCTAPRGHFLNAILSWDLTLHTCLQPELSTQKYLQETEL